ncbi:pirin family protein [Paenibacillus sp. ACRRX]|uniref:pirin family protein n=1 Tax=Paenibacillus sp. ACRRX TaxID=2918206 RepID=UPI001EF5CA13|nr:pirin-like bicupin family protein [Paenibacillus sp. ACRRX]MCG7408656.1 pirin family protein [Paenibacillus sp. ACRRX]
MFAINMDIHRAEDRYTADHGWLRSNFNFSFADYADADNLHFSSLRVLNDDYISPGTGFDLHPHHNMEIVTIVLEGQLEHQDSTGNKEFILPGQVQRMSAGTGIYHSEHNASEEKKLHLLQLWFFPELKDAVPSYETFTYGLDHLRGQLLPVVSNKSGELNTAHIHQDMTLYLSKPEAGQTICFRQQAARSTYIFVIEGHLKLHDGTLLYSRDDARIINTNEIRITANEDSHFMLIDLP